MRASLVSATGVSLALSVVSCPAAHAIVEIDYVTVDNLANPADSNGLGSVAGSYRIGRTEVTNTQYAEFLNSVDAAGTNPLALYNNLMASSPLGGILFNITLAEGDRYSVKPGYANKPAVYVSYYDAMRFVNWLGNGQTPLYQGQASTENGAYDLNNGAQATRRSAASVFLPSRDEWHKAAYYQPDTSGGPVGGYWTYPVQTNTFPISSPPPGITGSGNFYGSNGFAITGSTTFDELQNYLVDVGAYGASPSFYGTFDQAGNVREWTETSGLSLEKYALGGSWNDFGFVTGASNEFSLGAASEDSMTGFRVAAVPEPASAILALGLTPLLLCRRHPRQVVVS